MQREQGYYEWVLRIRQRSVAGKYFAASLLLLTGTHASIVDYSPGS